jgi:hypothetical protein
LQRILEFLTRRAQICLSVHVSQRAWNWVATESLKPNLGTIRKRDCGQFEFFQIVFKGLEAQVEATRKLFR